MEEYLQYLPWSCHFFCWGWQYTFLHQPISPVVLTSLHNVEVCAFCTYLLNLMFFESSRFVVYHLTKFRHFSYAPLLRLSHRWQPRGKLSHFRDAQVRTVEAESALITSFLWISGSRCQFVARQGFSWGGLRWSAQEELLLLRRNNALQAGKEMGEPEEGRCPEHFARAGDP